LASKLRLHIKTSSQPLDSIFQTPSTPRLSTGDHNDSSIVIQM
jgi:hypothetical protein